MPESENEPDDLRQRACVALARIGSDGAKALFELLTEANPFVRREVASVLGLPYSLAKKEAVIAALTQTLQDEDEGVRTKAREALGNIDSNWK